METFIIAWLVALSFVVFMLYRKTTIRFRWDDIKAQMATYEKSDSKRGGRL